MNKDFYIGALLSDCGKYRYKLWRRWTPDLPSLVWVMLNPSTADAEKDDATIRRCVGFARAWGFGGIEVYNLFAYRATHPRSLFETRDAIGPKNDEYLREISKSDAVMVAWGAFPRWLGNRDRDVLLLLNEGRTAEVQCLGMTAAGYPRHPVRLPNDTKRELYLKPTSTPTRVERQEE